MNNTMIELKIKLKEILSFIKDKNDVIYLDYPMHHNVGDLLIYQGALKLLSDNGVKIKTFRSADDYNIDEIRGKLTPNTTILCHGGGNFGDIYHAHQSLRENVVKGLKENRIIILPQTAFFKDDNNLKKAKEIFLSHNDVVLFARDINTLKLFKEFSDKSYLMPDTAHYLYGEMSTSIKNKGTTLYFMRIDCEANPFQDALLAESGDAASIDWADIITIRDKAERKLLRKTTVFGKNYKLSFVNDLVSSLWRSHCIRITKRSSELFSSYDQVITSRMHGHILSCLVDTPNKILDNSYGKNSGYYSQWTSKIDSAVLVKD
ncbi:TPA: polysaccharide pyruvyl transferase family protein [Raoultella terrigena]|uniref:Polysaccharide pyruvyl transferase family protein n=1 Tax=Raoultella terrigena TaxID=577 RepID=A0AAP9XSF8_RAOTE|nr:polysaccharide pyruvyl transferase family protein [Raoultella terrigena]QPF10354.1 polysaccharide pyruvyl transferase family protein [Raoultella terrigena]